MGNQSLTWASSLGPTRTTVDDDCFELYPGSDMHLLFEDVGSFDFIAELTDIVDCIGEDDNDDCWYALWFITRHIREALHNVVAITWRKTGRMPENGDILAVKIGKGDYEIDELFRITQRVYSTLGSSLQVVFHIERLTERPGELK